MNNWENSKISVDTSIIDAVKIIDKNGLQIALIVNENDKLLGVVTDGDIRRGIIKGISFDSPISEIMNDSPVTVSQTTELNIIREIMSEYIVHQVPIIDDDGIVVDLISFTDVLRRIKISTPVILMVGGLGSRLKDITAECPKPLVNVGSKPILQTIIEELSNQGFFNIFLSVNYKSEMIEDYFKDGESLGVSIKYIRERNRMGTAGSLSLLPDEIKYPIIVMNGDILTKLDYKQMLQFHEENQSIATMAVREFESEIPFGVIIADDKQETIRTIKEKPKETYLVNAGIYILGKKAIDMIPPDSFFDMTQLFETIIGAGNKAMMYKVKDYWIDIGRIEDLKKARSEYGNYF